MSIFFLNHASFLASAYFNIFFGLSVGAVTALLFLLMNWKKTLTSDAIKGYTFAGLIALVMVCATAVLVMFVIGPVSAGVWVQWLIYFVSDIVAYFGCMFLIQLRYKWLNKPKNPGS